MSAKRIDIFNRDNPSGGNAEEHERSNQISGFNQGRGKQHGAALLIMLVILVVGIAAILVDSLTASSVKTARQATTAAALAQAKAALIGYAITYADTHSGQVPGYLPCPDTDASNGEGSSILTCGSQDVSVIGRLPWATLDVSALRDGDGECLWYAVSGTYKNNPKTGLMNWDTNGQFQAYASDGTLLTTDAGNQVVAVIFAPGAPLSGQNRSPDGTAPICGGNYTSSNYLDNDTVHSINNSDVATGKFIQGTGSGNVNDHMVSITRQDIWNAMLKRSDFMTTLETMTQKAAECLANYGKRNYYYYYGDKRLPWSGRFYPSSSDYKTDSSYDDESGRLAGRLPYRVNTSQNDTSNYINSPWYQLVSDGDNCPGVSAWPTYYPWWTNWKDHVYYAVSSSFDPSSSNFYSDWWGWHGPNCGTCVQVNGTKYAAVVIFAGQALASTSPSQSRTTDADRLDPANYLEGSNLTNINNYTSGSGTYTRGTATSTSNNDLLYCIDQNLNVAACP
jgi:type II secretory pathway pseudopilin PulG